MPGGFVDLGESVEDAAIREVEEELHLRVELTHLIGVYSSAQDRTVVVVYAATTTGTPDSHGGGPRGAGVCADHYSMAGPGLLERQESAERPPRRVGRWLQFKARSLLNLRRLLALALVLVATCAGGYLALVSYHDDASALGRGDPDVDRSRASRGARRLRPAGGLGRALRGDPRADPPAGGPPDRRPDGRPGPGRRRVAGRQPRPQRRREGAQRLPAAADRVDGRVLARARAAGGVRDPLARPAAALDGVAGGRRQRRDRRGDGRARPAPGRDLRPPVLRPRPGHPARAGGGRGRAEDLRRARPGARRAAGRARAARRRSGPPAVARQPARDHRGQRPAQQRGRRRPAQPPRRRRPGLLPRRPDRPRVAVRDQARAARGEDRRPVRVRLGQPRLGLLVARARPRGGDGAHAQRAARQGRAAHRADHQPGQGPPGRGLRRPVRAADGRVLRGPLRPRAGPGRAGASSSAGCSRCWARSTS